jgi:hypothetical protein
MTRWPSGLRRQIKALVRKGVGSNPTLVRISFSLCMYIQYTLQNNLNFYLLDFICVAAYIKRKKELEPQVMSRRR